MVCMTPFQQRQLTLMRQMETRLASGSNASTIVPVQTDYINDPQLALSLNAYLPKEIATTIRTRLIEPLKVIDPTHYYYPVEALHVTIHSVRIIHDPPMYTPQDIETSKRLLEQRIPLEQPFPFVFHGVMSLPTSVAVIALITPEYDRFAKSLRRAFIDTGIPDDKTYFTDEMVFANTTFCRYTQKPTQAFLEKLQTLKDLHIGEFVATEASLVEINAGAHPSKTRVFGTYEFAQNRG